MEKGREYGRGRQLGVLVNQEDMEFKGRASKGRFKSETGQRKRKHQRQMFGREYLICLFCPGV